MKTPMLASRFKSVRGRLLAVMLLILAPIGVVSVILASTTYHAVIGRIEAAQMEVGSSYAVRVRVWYRGMLRTLVATQAALRVVADNDVECSNMAETIRAGTLGLQAVLVRFDNGVQCFASSLPSLRRDVLQSTMERQSRLPKLRQWGGFEIGESRYDALQVGDRAHPIIFMRTGAETAAQGAALAGMGAQSLLVVDSSLLDAAFDIGQFEAGAIVALVRRGGAPLVARGVSETETAWLPREEVIETALWRRVLPSRSGEVSAYVGQVVAEPDLYVLASFPNTAANAAYSQFLILILSPLAMLAVLFWTYIWTVEGNVLRWLASIQRAAQARGEGRREQVPIADAMPSDVKVLASAFNEMVSDADSREASLRAAAEANRYLMRELHHRVKNSLQVIQSYLALSRRLQKRNTDRHLIETEAKVQVLSSAYRLALAEGAMRPVPLDQFADEVVGNLINALRQRDQWIEVDIKVDAGLNVDRAIPMGLALVESVSAGLAAERASLVKVTVGEDGQGLIRLTVTTDGVVGDHEPPQKIMDGLALQIGAEATTGEPTVIIDWRFTA